MSFQAGRASHAGGHLRRSGSHDGENFSSTYSKNKHTHSGAASALTKEAGLSRTAEPGKLPDVKKKGRSELSKEAGDRARALLNSLLADRFQNNKRALGRELGGITGSAVFYLSEGKTRASRATAERLAQLAGVPIGDILGEGMVIENRGRFPGLEKCLAYHRSERWAAPVVAAARAGAYTDDVEPEQWARRLDDIESKLAGLTGGAPISTRPAPS